MLTQKLGLGAENIIARLAFSYSLAQNRELNLLEIQDTQGKEYSEKTLFGVYRDIYVSLICTKYKLTQIDKSLYKYIKMHIDDGLTMLALDFKKNGTLTGLEFLTNQIQLSSFDSNDKNP